MSLAKIDVRHVRNIDCVSLEPSPHLNYVIGANGSGKTSLLEAIYILGRGRSFRSNQAGQVISFSCDSLTVSGKAFMEGRIGPVNLGVQLSKQGREMVLDGKKLQSSAELIWAFPVLLISPGSSALLDDAPKHRRQFLDWGAFHLEHSYLDCWRGFSKALRQRNALLRRGDVHNLQTWNHELGRYGTMVASARERYVDRLRPYFLDAAKYFLGIEGLVLRTTPGWDQARSLLEVLGDEAGTDCKFGFTRSGPHRGDLGVVVEGRSARNVFSRGQMKMLVFALLLAQGHLLEESVGTRGCVLIDDLASELDAKNRAKLLHFVAQRKGQFFITATDDWGCEQTIPETSAVFHVEQGRLTHA